MSLGSKKAGRNYAEFADKVRAAAKKTKRVHPGSQNGNANLTSRDPKFANAAPRCQKPGVLKRTGLPCRAAAVRGGTRCFKHGGMRQVPEHPHNIKKYFEGGIDAWLQHVRDRTAYGAFPPNIKAIIDNIAAGFPRNYTRKLLGAQSYMLDDGGRAWRRWIKSLQER